MERRTPGKDVDVSVAICTRDRGQAVRATVESVRASAARSGLSVELVVVDNGTYPVAELAQLVEPAGAATAGTVLVREPIAGLSRARNTGSARARGAVLLFTDDDVTVPPTWVADMAGPMLAGTADAVAGAIRLAPELVRPWMTAWLRSQFADAPEPVAEGAFMIGASMGATAEVLQAIRFNEDLGAAPYQRGEDAFFWEQLVHAGYRVAGVSTSCVLHRFDERRLERAALLDLARVMGRCEAYVWHHKGYGALRLPRLRTLKHTSRATLLRLRRSEQPDAEMRAVAKAAFNSELRRLRHSRPKFPSLS